MLAIGRDRRVPTAPGVIRADELTAGLPNHAWQRLSAGPGAKGHRYYDWAPVALTSPVRVAGRRWTIEESFQAGKGLAGLDEHQLRRWTSWRRAMLLAMVAHSGDDITTTAPASATTKQQRAARQ